MFVSKFEYIKIILLAFLDSNSGNNYQAEKASDAIVNGGFFGKGIGEGTLNSRVPEAHTDYIVSVIAEEFGATDSVLATEKSPWRIAKSLIGRGADLVLVTVGNSTEYDIAPRYLGYGGKVVMVGMPKSGDKSAYEPVMMASVSQGMIGSKMGDVVIKRDIPWMVDLYDQGRIKLDELISKTWSLEQINEAIADTKLGSAKRNVIVFEV